MSRSPSKLIVTPFKKPMVRRYFWRLAALVFFHSVPGLPQELGAAGLTEEQAVASALERSALKEVTRGAVSIETGRARVAGAYSNPQLSYMREQTFGNTATGEDYLLASQSVDLGNRRGLRSDAGELRARAAEHQGNSLRLDVAAETRRRFHSVLLRMRRVAALEAWRARIDEALAIVTRRQARGDAADYDSKRLQREQAVAFGRLEAERAELDRARARLQAIIGSQASADPIAGTLLPGNDPPSLATLRVNTAARPDLRALDDDARAAALDEKAAGRWWVPDLRIEGGWKGVGYANGSRSDGFLLGAAVALPLWDRSQGLAGIARAETSVARGRRALIESEALAEVPGTRAEAVRLRQAAIAMQSKTGTLSADLVRIANAGYGGGELGILELLDAYRGTAEDALTLADLEYAARVARIELDRQTGVTPR